MWARLRSFVVAVVRRGRFEDTLSEELRFHLEAYADDLIAKGLSREEAYRQARVHFGSVERVREECRQSRGLRFIDELSQDLRYGARHFVKALGFAAVALLTLAVGIGANAAIFSVIHAVLLNPFPFPAHEPDRVLVVAEQPPGGGRMSVSYPTFRDWVDQLESFDVVSGYRDETYTLTGTHDPTRVQARQTSFTYFGIHGILPLHGRLYDTNDDRFGAARVAVLNYPLWQELFGARPDVVGETITLSDDDYTVVGVLPPGVDVSPETRVYLPLEPWAANNEAARGRGNHFGLYVHGRLAPSVTFDQARAELLAIAARFEEEYPETNSGVGVVVDRLPEWRLRNYRTILWVLQAAVVILLLIACANVANLMLARAVTRRRQYAISAALGAGPLRTLRQSLVENLMLSVTAGGVGLLVALGAVRILGTMTPFDVPRLAEAQLNWPVAAFAAGLAILTGLVGGLLPGIQVVRQTDVTAVLNEEGSHARAAVGGRRLHRGLLVTEVALATLLLVGAGLLIRTIVELTRVDPGFHNERILTARLLLADDALADPDVVAVFRDLRRRVDTVPSVVSSSLVASLPLQGTNWTSVFTVADQPVPARADLPSAAFNPVDSGYFETMGIPLLEGRFTGDSDRRESPRVVVVTETLARRHWPTESALGKRLKQGWPEDEGDGNPWRQVVGVVGDIRQDGLDAEPRAEAFIPSTQVTFRFMALVVRTTGDPMNIVEPVRAAVRAAHPNLLAYSVRSMDDIMATQLAPRRFVMWALSAFGLVALLIAAVGIYGILAHSVAQRSHELGIRMALGADRGRVRGLVLRESLLTALAGVVVAAGGSFVVTRVLESVLFQPAAIDPWLWVLVPLFVVTVAALAAVVPASRAARTDPVVSLRGV